MEFLLALVLFTQGYTQRGFVESQITVYPENSPNDSANVVGAALARYEGFYKPTPGLQLAGALDARIDTHHEVDRNWRISWQDRERQRPLAAVRRLSAVYNDKGLTVEAGKQFVRWGKTDIVNPTDRFAPRDYLSVIDTEFIAISAVRATYERGANTVDAVWAPRFTPSRIPLSNQRWFPGPTGVPLPQTDVRFPSGFEGGLRWSYIGQMEFSLSFYEGYNHAPSFEAISQQFTVAQFYPTVTQFYPRLRMVGADAAVPFRWLTLKLETAYFTSPDKRADEYGQFVIQGERQSGEWSFVGGYAGEVITRHGTAAGFDPQRGATRTFLGRAGYTIDANRSFAVEAALRQDGSSLYTRLEYSQAFGQHWRMTPGFTLIRGASSDFVGQYHRNSRGQLAVRYSF